MQAKRSPGWESIWYWTPYLLHLGMKSSSDAWVSIIDWSTPALLCAGSLLTLRNLWVKPGAPMAAGAALLSLLLVTSKLNSPQYALWLTPFFVLTEVPIFLVVSYFAANAFVFFSDYRMFASLPNPNPGILETLLISGVMIQGALLLVLFFWFTFFARDRVSLTESQADHRPA
jgi:hypothetical protein